MGRLTDKHSACNTLPNVRSVSTFADAKSLWSSGKIPGKSSLTNFFLNQRSIERAIKKDNLWGIAQSGASLLLRRDRDFFHLYINFSDQEVLRTLLTKLNTETPLVVDVIQRNNSHHELIAILKDAGFGSHRLLFRLNRKVHAIQKSTEVDSVGLANLTHAAEILNFLEKYFDKYSEQIPEIDEIEEAILNRQILLSLIDDEIAGFLYFESFGLASSLRYWFVNPKFRDQNIGSALIRHYLAVSCQNMSSHLWVVHDNYNALSKYEHYGYTRDVLEDHVMIRR